MKYGQYFIVAGSNSFFRFADGHFDFAKDIPNGHHNMSEAVRALGFARSKYPHARIVTMEITLTDVPEEEVNAKIRESIIRKVNENFTEEEQRYLRRVMIKEGQ